MNYSSENQNCCFGIFIKNKETVTHISFSIFDGVKFFLVWSNKKLNVKLNAKKCTRPINIMVTSITLKINTWEQILFP